MKHKVIDSQAVIKSLKRTGAEKYRTRAEENRTDAEYQRKCAAEKVVQISQINVNTLVYTDSFSYNNGSFVPVFQDALYAMTINPRIKCGTWRVLILLLARVDEKNIICIDRKEMAHVLQCSDDTVNRAIKILLGMNIICERAGKNSKHQYEICDKVLNPRLAFKGNTRRLNKRILPILLQPESVLPLLSSGLPESEF